MRSTVTLSPDEATFQDALARAARGEAEGFSHLYRRHQGALLAFLRTQGASDAEDLASETWIAATRTIKNFSGTEAQFRSWLVTIGRRRLIDHYRASARRPRATEFETQDPVAATPDPAEVAATNDLAARTLAALDQLSADEAEVIRLRVLAGVETPEVAAILGRSTTAVRVLQHRALKKLAALLEAHRDDAGPGAQATGNTAVPPTMEGME